MNDYFKEQNEKIIKDLSVLLEQHLPEDQLDVILEYCEKNGLEVESVVKVIKKNSNLKSKLFDALVGVKAINDSV